MTEFCISIVLIKCGKDGPEKLSNLLEGTHSLSLVPTGGKGQDVEMQGFEPRSLLHSHWLFYSPVVHRHLGVGGERCSGCRNREMS